MKDEIKEILDINIGDDREAYIDYIDKDGKRKNYEYIEAEDLLDYITNLQEKYERMKENAEILSNGCNELEKRNEKAIEYIENAQERDGDEESCSLHVPTLKSILEGRSDE